MSGDLYDPAVNAEYMPSQRVPNAEAIFEAWPVRSAAVRREHPPTLLRYGDGPHEVIDLFEPVEQARGTVLFIHGGYWVAFYKEDFSYLAPPLLTAGWRVAVMSYDLAPSVTLRHIVGQAQAAASAVAQACEGPLIVTGHSAGGHLAAMLHATAWAGKEKLCGSVGVSGLYRLAPLRQTELQPDLRLSAAEADALSPVHLQADPRPFVAAVGELESDAFKEQSHGLARAWPSARLEVLPEKHHFDAPDCLPTLVESLLNPDRLA